MAIQILETRLDQRLTDRTSVFATTEDVARLEGKISEAKVDIIKWVVTMAIAVIGLVVAVIKLL